MSLGVSKRRVQRLGGSSLIVTLPKSWAKKVGVGIGDEVVVVDEGDHLKIVPAGSRLAGNISSVTVKLAGYVKEMEPSDLAKCAFISGYDSVIIELPRSNGVNHEKLLEELRASEYVQEAVQVMNIVEAQLLSAMEGDRKFLKLIANIAANAIDSAAKGAYSREEAGREYEKARLIVDMLARSVFKNKVLSCSGENINPLTVGILYSLLSSIQHFIDALLMEGDPSKTDIAKEVSGALVQVASAAANASGKRLLEILSELEERSRRIASYNSTLAGLALGIMASLKELAWKTLCLSTTLYRQE